jgi:hypothetical protein
MTRESSFPMAVQAPDQAMDIYNVSEVGMPNLGKWALRVGGVGVTLSGLGLAACGEAPTTQVKTTAQEAAATQAVDQECGVKPNLNALRANSEFGSPESLFPSLQTVDKKTGKTVLVTPEAASGNLQAQLASDYRVLAVWTAFVTDAREKQQQPDTGTLPRAQKLMEIYQSGTPGGKLQAEQDLAKACAAADALFLKPTDHFGVAKGQTYAVQTERANGHAVTGSP